MSDRAAVRRRDQFNRQLLELFAHKDTRPEYLGAVVEILREWSGCRCVGIRVLDEAGNIPYGAYVGFDESFWKSESNLSIDCDNCICIRVVKQRPELQELPIVTAGGSIRSNRLSCLRAHLAGGHYRGACGRRGFESLAVIPIRFRDCSLGAIHLADERPDMVGDDAIEFIESITVMIGEAIHRFNVEEALRRNVETLRRQACQLRDMAAQLTEAERCERKRIAEVLHDELQQLLVGATYSLRLVRKREELSAVREAALDAEKIVMDAIGVTRSLCAELNPRALEHGLGKGLEWLGDWMRDKQGLQVEVEIDPMANPKSQSVAAVMFQCVRELLFNVVKHAHVDRASVRLILVAGCAEIEVGDDGVGFDPKLIESGLSGLGLASVRERIQMLGGRFDIESLPGQGARFRLAEPSHSAPIEPGRPDVQLAPAELERHPS